MSKRKFHSTVPQCQIEFFITCEKSWDDSPCMSSQVIWTVYFACLAVVKSFISFISFSCTCRRLFTVLLRSVVIEVRKGNVDTNLHQHLDQPANSRSSNKFGEF